ncbi:MAG: hypothetical protein AVDCRST_MAG77-1144, partial [uncultured Chloroflexi bacterium]
QTASPRARSRSSACSLPAAPIDRSPPRWLSASLRPNATLPTSTPRSAPEDALTPPPTRSATAWPT